MTAIAETHLDVLVATRNRPDDLRHLLDWAVRQSHPRFTLVVLDQSDDPTANAAAVESLADQRVRHVPLTTRGKSTALNEGLRLTDSDLVAFTDDDCQLDRRWLQRTLESMSLDPDAALLFGDVTPAPHDPMAVYVPSVHFDERRTLSGPLIRSPGLIGMGANMTIRRRALEQVGLFDEDLGPGGPLHTGEEVELAYRMLRAGFHIIQDPGIAVVHHGARPIAGRVAADLVNTGFFAMGCGYGKNARAGDWRAAVVAAHEIGQILVAMVQAVAARRRPVHVRRLFAFAKGLWTGFVTGPSAAVAPQRLRLPD